MDGGRKVQRREERHSLEDLRPLRGTFCERAYPGTVLKTEAVPAERHRTVKGDSGPIGRQEDDSEPNYDGWWYPPTISFYPRPSRSRCQSRSETMNGSRMRLCRDCVGCKAALALLSMRGAEEKEAQRVNIGPAAHTLKPEMHDRCWKDSTSSRQLTPSPHICRCESDLNKSIAQEFQTL